MEGEIKRFGIDGAEVCMTSIAGRGRGAEREATQRLVEEMFGSGTVLGHTACGAPKVEGYGDGRVSVSNQLKQSLQSSVTLDTGETMP